MKLSMRVSSLQGAAGFILEPAHVPVEGKDGEQLVAIYRSHQESPMRHQVPVQHFYNHDVTDAQAVEDVLRPMLDSLWEGEDVSFIVFGQDLFSSGETFEAAIRFGVDAILQSANEKHIPNHYSVALQGNCVGLYGDEVVDLLEEQSQSLGGGAPASSRTRRRVSLARTATAPRRRTVSGQDVLIDQDSPWSKYEAKEMVPQAVLRGASTNFVVKRAKNVSIRTGAQRDAFFSRVESWKSGHTHACLSAQLNVTMTCSIATTRTATMRFLRVGQVKDIKGGEKVHLDELLQYLGSSNDSLSRRALDFGFHRLLAATKARGDHSAGALMLCANPRLGYEALQMAAQTTKADIKVVLDNSPPDVIHTSAAMGKTRLRLLSCINSIDESFKELLQQKAAQQKTLQDLRKDVADSLGILSPNYDSGGTPGAASLTCSLTETPRPDRSPGDGTLRVTSWGFLEQDLEADRNSSFGDHASAYGHEGVGERSMEKQRLKQEYLDKEMETKAARAEFERRKQEFSQEVLNSQALCRDYSNKGMKLRRKRDEIEALLVQQRTAHQYEMDRIKKFYAKEVDFLQKPGPKAKLPEQSRVLELTLQHMNGSTATPRVSHKVRDTTLRTLESQKQVIKDKRSSHRDVVGLQRAEIAATKAKAEAIEASRAKFHGDEARIRLLFEYAKHASECLNVYHTTSRGNVKRTFRAYLGESVPHIEVSERTLPHLHAVRTEGLQWMLNCNAATCIQRTLQNPNDASADGDGITGGGHFRGNSPQPTETITEAEYEVSCFDYGPADLAIATRPSTSCSGCQSLPMHEEDPLASMGGMVSVDDVKSVDSTNTNSVSGGFETVSPQSQGRRGRSGSVFDIARSLSSVQEMFSAVSNERRASTVATYQNELSHRQGLVTQHYTLRETLKEISERKKAKRRAGSSLN